MDQHTPHHITNALVLGGGAIKGAYQAGAIQVILKRGFVPDGIYGTSVGAINGGWLADRAGRAVRAGNEPDWPALGNGLLDFWQTEITSFADIGKKRKNITQVWDIVRGKFRSLISMDAVTATLRRELDYDNIAASSALYHAGVVDLKSTDFIYATADRFGANDLIDYIIASTREPVIMPLMWKGRNGLGPPVFGKGDRKYANVTPLGDGGVRNIAPMKGAIEDGASKIVTVACQPEKLTALKDTFNYGNIINLLRHTIGIMENEIVNNDVTRLTLANKMVTDGTPLRHDHREIDFTLVRPTEALGIPITDFTIADIRMMIKKGKEDARAALDHKADRPGTINA